MLLSSQSVQNKVVLVHTLDPQVWQDFLNNERYTATLSNTDWYALVSSAKSEMLRTDESCWRDVYLKCCLLAYRGFPSAEGLFDASNERLYVEPKAIEDGIFAISRFCAQDNCEALYEKVLASGQPLFWIALFNNADLTEVLFRSNNLCARQLTLMSLFDQACRESKKIECQRLILVLATFTVQYRILNLHRFYDPALLIAVPHLRQLVFSDPFLARCNVQFIAEAVAHFEDDFVKVLKHFKKLGYQLDVQKRKLAQFRCVDFVSQMAAYPQLKSMMQADDELKNLMLASPPYISNARIARGLLNVFPELLDPLLQHLQTKFKSDTHSAGFKNAFSTLMQLNKEGAYSAAISRYPDLQALLPAPPPVPPRVNSLPHSTSFADLETLCATVDAFAPFTAADQNNDAGENTSAPAVLNLYSNSVIRENEATFAADISELEKMRGAWRSPTL